MPLEPDTGGFRTSQRFEPYGQLGQRRDEPLGKIESWLRRPAQQGRLSGAAVRSRRWAAERLAGLNQLGDDREDREDYEQHEDHEDPANRSDELG